MDNQGNIRNFGNLLAELSQTVPDGMICYFSSHKQMQHFLILWNDMKLLQKVLENKLIFVETNNHKENMVLLHNFKKACDSGRGGILFCLARSSMIRGVDLSGHYCRALVIFGIPFEPILTRNLKVKIQYLSLKYGVDQSQYLITDAVKVVSECLCRALRNKDDYCLMLLADYRFSN